MERFIQEASRNTPEILFDPDKNVFSIKGTSHPENTKEFYNPLFNWLDRFYNTATKNTIISLELNFEYMNSSTLKLMVEMMRILDKFREKTPSIEIVWHYEQDDISMRETGIELFELSDIHLPFRFFPHPGQ
jgi:hypothetical protein